jgi:hypothetical protein
VNGGEIMPEGKGIADPQELNSCDHFEEEYNVD